MANPLFDRAPLEDLASSEQHIEFKGKISDFAWLVEIVTAELTTVSEDKWPQRWQEAPVDIRLDFAWQDRRQKIPTISGRACGLIPMVCQRCLEVFELSLDTSLNMIIAHGDAKDGGLPDLAGYEVWEIAEGSLRPLDLVEESLVMAMPLAPRHESEDSCGALAREIAESGLKTAHPFADLRSQMENLNN